jgi:DNA-directed RNA polymerase specialized sigma24 family protein
MERSLRSSGDPDPPGDPPQAAVPGLPVYLSLAHVVYPTDHAARRLAERNEAMTRALVTQLCSDFRAEYRDGNALQLAIWVYGPATKGYLSRQFHWLRSDPDAHRSAFNETFWRFAQRITEFDERRGVRLTTWLLSHAHAAARAERDLLRKEDRQKQAHLDALSRPVDPTTTTPRPRRDAEILAEVINEQPEPDRVMIVGPAVDLSYDDLAGVIGSTPGAAERRSQRAIHRIRADYDRRTNLPAE